MVNSHASNLSNRITVRGNALFADIGHSREWVVGNMGRLRYWSHSANFVKYFFFLLKTFKFRTKIIKIQTTPQVRTTLQSVKVPFLEKNVCWEWSFADMGRLRIWPVRGYGSFAGIHPFSKFCEAFFFCSKTSISEQKQKKKILHKIC